MEETRWDRQVYVPKAAPPASNGSALIGPAIGLLSIGVVALGGFLYVRAYGFKLPDSRPDPQMQLMTARLEEMTARLEELEARLRITPPPSKVPPLPAQAQNAAAAKPVRTPARRASSGTTLLPAAGQTGPAGPAPSASLAPLHPAQFDDRVLHELRGELTSSREAWDAASNRIGDTVGELGNQRREIDNTRAALDQLERNMQRNFLPFALRRENGRQRVGPVWMDLRSIDRKGQRFSLSLYFDDRWVEVKDRVLGERVEFYIAGYSQPLELVVSNIGHEEVRGRLAIPVSPAGNH